LKGHQSARRSALALNGFCGVCNQSAKFLAPALPGGGNAVAVSEQSVILAKQAVGLAIRRDNSAVFVEQNDADGQVILGRPGMLDVYPLVPQISGETVSRAGGGEQTPQEI